MAAERPKKKRRKKLTPKRAAAELVIEKRREQATKLRLAGWSIRDIAGHLKVGVATAHADIAAVLERTRDKSEGYVERERMMSLARLDVATKGIWPGIESGDHEAVDRLVKLEQRRARVVGFDAPQKIESEVTTFTLDDLDQLKRSAKDNECSQEGQPSKSELSGSSS